MNARVELTRYRTVWVSDTHLGTRGCRADLLLEFLRSFEADELYLVGDIIDGWRLKKSWYWAPSHSEVVHEVLAKARRGTRVIYVPGNHDEVLREYVGLMVGTLEVQRQAIHTTADGRRLPVLHGDQFDGIVNHAKWLAKLGDWAYTLTLELNRQFNAARHRMGFGYWSLSAYLKGMVKGAVSFIDNFEHAIAEEARRHGVDGVVCGHIHKAEMREIEGILYCNDGDWVEGCTALIEQPDGTLQLIHWAEERQTHARRTAAAAYAA